jgi:membrane-associated PAP2 superfamily phosphatase
MSLSIFQVSCLGTIGGFVGLLIGAAVVPAFFAWFGYSPIVALLGVPIGAVVGLILGIVISLQLMAR